MLGVDAASNRGSWRPPCQASVTSLPRPHRSRPRPLPRSQQRCRKRHIGGPADTRVVVNRRHSAKLNPRQGPSRASVSKPKPMPTSRRSTAHEAAIKVLVLAKISSPAKPPTPAGYSQLSGFVTAAAAAAAVSKAVGKQANLSQAPPQRWDISRNPQTQRITVNR